MQAAARLPATSESAKLCNAPKVRRMRRSGQDGKRYQTVCLLRIALVSAPLSLAASGAAVLRPTKISESPRHGITLSRRRHNHTVLSNNLSVSLLIRREPAILLYIHQGG